MSNTKEPIRELIPEPVLRRLPWYLSYVSLLKERHVEYVSSTTISRDLHVDGSQIAKDLSFLKLKGKTRIGYPVDQLCQELREFLGFERGHAAVLMGAGSLGGALLQDAGLQRYGLNIVAAFDVDPDKAGTDVRGIPVCPVGLLPQLCKELKAEIGVITVPAEHAQSAADALIAAGVKALWNFTPFRISAPEGIVIANTSIYAHLAVMYNRLGSTAAPTE